MQRIEAIRHMAQVVNQGIDGRGITLRTFGLDPTGRMLVAASQIPLPVRGGASVKMLSAGVSVYRIRANGELDFVRKYDVDVGGKNQFSFGSGTHLSFTEAASNLGGTLTVTDAVHTTAARPVYGGAVHLGERWPLAVVRPGSEKINSATAVLIGHAPHGTKKGQNGLEAQPALSRLEALEERSVGQSGRQAKGLTQQGAPPLGLGSVGQVDAFQAGVGCRATKGDADIPRDHNAVGRAVGIDMAERAWKRNPRYRGLRPWKKGQSGNPPAAGQSQ